MTAQHTPGPWTYTHEGLEDFSLDAGDVNIIGGCGCCGSPSINSEADARLVAAAPDLLDAMQELMPGCEAMGWSTTKAREAIAKATGETP